MTGSFPSSSTPIQSWLAQAGQLLPDSPSAKLDVEVLLCHVLDANRSYLYTWPERSLSAVQYDSFISLLGARQQGNPIAHLTGVREFWSLPLHVSPTTLIPRPDTEVLVEWVLGQFENETMTVLDLGTGTGAIALALASEYSNWHVTGCDRIAQAVELATENSEALDLKRVRFIESDWFASFEGQVFDLIVSNPPYIPSCDPHLLEGDVLFEPKSALVSGDDGLVDIRMIVSEAEKYLTERGCLVIEHGYDQAESVQTIFRQAGYVAVGSGQDYGGQDRFTYGWISGEGDG